LEAVNTTLFVPAVVGVPVIRPLVAIFSPAGRLDPPKIIGAVPLAVTVLLNATPTCPRKELVEVMAGGVPYGLELTAGDAEATVMMLDMAAGTVSEAMFIEWVRTSVVKQ
jgi:hypothetical protein